MQYTIEQLKSLSGKEFELICGKLLSSMGFDVEYTKASHDGGIDIIANNSAPLLKGRYVIQCKCYSGTVGAPVVRELTGVVFSEKANKGILITTSDFTLEAKKRHKRRK